MRKLDRNALKELIQSVMHVHHQDIGCDECLEEMDRFAEARLVGKEPDEALALVQQHLSYCPFCREEFEALLNALQALGRSQ